MTLPKHPGIDMVHNMRERAGYTDDWEVNAPLDRDIMNNLRKSKALLDAQMSKTAPEKVSDKDIFDLRKFEVAIVYAGLTDPENKTAQMRLKSAIEGRDAMNQPTDSARYASRKAYAEENLSSPGARVSTTLEF